MSSVPPKPTWRSGYYGKLQPERVLAIRRYVVDVQKHLEVVGKEVADLAALPPTPRNLTNMIQRANYLHRAAYGLWGYTSAVEYYDAEGKFNRKSP